MIEDARKTIIELLGRKPFVAFRLVTKAGVKYEVTGPHRAAVGEDLIVVLPPGSAHQRIRTDEIIAFELSTPVA